MTDDRAGLHPSLLGVLAGFVTIGGATRRIRPDVAAERILGLPRG